MIRTVRILLTTALLALPPVAVLSPPAAATPTTAPRPVSHRVTLITGDVVDYTDLGGGHHTLSVEPAAAPDRAGVAFQTMSTSDDSYVFPTDVVPAIAAGEVDRALFDVTELVREGLDDASARSLPVIVSYPARTMLPAAAPPAAQQGVAIPALPARGMRVDRAHAADFWRAVAPPAGAAKPALGMGITHIALDRKAHVTLDQSAPQVGAPAAWAAGLDGAGTTVGIVDTGIDLTHPDLAGAVVAAANFTTDPGVTDSYGHGTHVASIIAGTGKASGGRYRGIAPGAKLVIAKVFDASGSGTDSQVMAGMEWAAEHGAKVINLSLGAGPTDGTDDISRLVDQLTEQTGALFVVAAGNSGPGDLSVEAPGAAADALTVGAVSKQDALAAFSSRGPRLGDATVKPEIAAPGVSIVAARAAGTSMGDPVDDYYTAASGTSMATPHVTGGAAILLQQHPDWTAAQLKQTLVSSAHDDGLAWYQQGAGRLDIARAISQPVSGTATVSFGRTPRAGAVQPKLVRTLGYTNRGSSPVTLTLSVSAKAWTGKPATNFTLGTTSLTVPAKSTATTTLTADPNAGDPGVYGGIVTATAGGTAVRTVIDIYDAPMMHPVTVHVLDSAGNPAASGLVQLISDTAATTLGNDPYTEQPGYLLTVSGGTATAQVPAGTYSALATVTEQGLTSRRWTALSAAEVSVKAGTDITLDARSAVPVTVSAATPTEQRDRMVALRRALPSGRGSGYMAEVAIAAGAKDWRVYATPAPATHNGVISLQDTDTLQTAAVDLRVGATALHPLYDSYSMQAKWSGDRQLPVVPVGSDYSVAKGKVALVRIPEPAGSSGAAAVALVSAAAAQAATAAAQAGAAALVCYVDSPGALPVAGVSSASLPVLALSRDEGAGLWNQPGVITLTVRRSPDAMYDLSYLDPNGIDQNQARIADPHSLVAIPTRYHAELPGLTATKQWYAFPTGRWVTEYQAGVKMPVPGAWTEYVGPGDDLTVWKRAVTLSAPQGALTMYALDRYRAGETGRPAEDWFQAPMHSSAPELTPDNPARYPDVGAAWRQTCAGCRGGSDPDMFVPNLQWSDSAPGHVTSPFDNGAYFTTTTAHLYAGATEIPRSNASDPYALFPVYELSAQPGTYRLDVTDVLATPPVVGAASTALFRTATRVDTSWRFASARSNNPPPTGYACLTGAACSFQPLIGLNYRFGLGLDDTAPAGRPFTFQLTAGSHTGAVGAGPVLGVRVSYSTDEGTTWNQATVTPSADGKVWSVVVADPTAGFVWLRTQAWDSAGNTVTQTVQRAYPVSAAG
ncbi:S8 family peptidase [Kutzneria sp. CA-103260]|uniref:S8 family peptidase n=1 Tax=Kutzneria sp. CA-103260 TaxID=2802641 RepID=UPI001BA90990|nr:S8 family peptidase [Kutzneria sp. CA-103260]QUQ66575.1 peptidase [Kutzneria sp. CA-103260]